MSGNGFVDYIIDILSEFGDIKYRRMFGGYGIYLNKIIFAIIINNEIYFKADRDLAEKYKASGSYPFYYKRDDKAISLSYWLVPSEVLEDGDHLKCWFDGSFKVAIDKKKLRI